MEMSGFSDSVEQVLQTASEAAIKYGSGQVGTEHVLFGLVCNKEGVASKVLSEFGVTKASMVDLFEENDNFIVNISGGMVEFSPRVKEMIKIAQKIAIELGHNYVGTEHLLLALISNTGSFAVRLLVTYYRVNLTALKSKLLNMLNTNQPQQKIKVQEGENTIGLPEKLLQMGTDITQKAREHKIDPIIGREEEIQRIIEILCRKTKNNPVLIGEAGVGKTAVVEGLALAIAQDNVPELLKNKIVYSLEIGSLMAGTKYRGSMEEKLKDAIDTIIANKNIIVFIDEIHTLAQAGSEKGETSPADMLKPYLARGEMQTIGATTTDEYRKFIEKDKALERRFQPVMINPPTVEQTIEILKGLRDSYEAFHKVTISDSAIEAAANLSDRYITDRNLPDKAIDLVDEASSKAKVNFNLKPSAIREKEEKLKRLQANRDEASNQRNYEKAAKLQTEIINLENQLNDMIEEFEKNKKSNSNVITSQEIAEVVSKWTGIPVAKITETEKEKLLNLEQILHKRVIGQDEAISRVAKAIRRSRVGIQDGKRPIGSFLFVGQTGVGKTELSKALAEAMFDNENSIIRVDMSEYMESHSVSKLIGSPPGYVGYDEGGHLTEQVRRKPYSVVLFDEIEKAHIDVLNILLSILDDGRVTDSQGRVVNFTNTIIIMTSNLGASEMERNRLGFGNKEDKRSAEEIYMEAIKKRFRPEFVNRIDSICVFHPLSKQDLTRIAALMISSLNKRLEKQDLKLEVTASALDYIVVHGSDPLYGARPLKRFIQQEIEDKIAEKILLGQLDKTGIITVSEENDNLIFKSN
jgi:ATP-dependent Clp protease ATP-binding subunit ClpC